MVQARSFGEGLDQLPAEAPIPDPWVERAAQTKPKSRWVVAAVVAACLGQVALVGCVSVAAVHYFSEAKRPVAKAEAESRTARDEVESKRDDGSPGDVVHAPMVAPPTQVGPTGSVPQETEHRDVGSLKVVEVGVKVPSLRQALSAEIAAAHAAGKEVLVMTTKSGCEPCSGVVKAMTEDSMQRALSPVVIVKVDVDVFDKDLDALQMQHDAIPGFFLVGPDAAPRDAIHGGEWGADTAENIAPVLGPFVRGEYTKRKNEWKKPMPRGVFL